MNPNELYIKLLTKCITDTLDSEKDIYVEKTGFINNLINKFLKPVGYALCKIRHLSFNNDVEVGKYHSANAITLIGYKRLESIKYCYENIIKDNIPGDILEAGVWKGGASIFIRALMNVNSDDRILYAADSFEGCPPPSLEIDKADNYGAFSFLEASLESVKKNFSKFDLLDNQVKFLEGWFKDTLPNAPFSKLSMVRIDGDMYESTMDVLTNVYDKVSVGGYILVDDYGGIEAARKAVDDFRTSKNIQDPIIKSDWTGIYWRKSK